jgi:hypothetical protein
MLWGTIGIGAETPEIGTIGTKRRNQFTACRRQCLVELAVTENDAPCPGRSFPDRRNIGRRHRNDAGRDQHFGVGGAIVANIAFDHGRKPFAARKSPLTRAGGVVDSGVGG